MKRIAVVNRTRGTTLGTNIAVADRWWSRLRGLIGRPEPRPGEGMLLMWCRAVHLHGIRYPLDIAFVDRRGAVVALYPRLRPNAWTHWHRRADHALELPAGTLEATGTREGDVLEWDDPARLALDAAQAS
jgi:uncharacterized membrane protein (UPF0127 family)